MRSCGGAQGRIYDQPLGSLQLPLLFVRGTADPYSPQPKWDELRRRVTSPDVTVRLRARPQRGTGRPGTASGWLAAASLWLHASMCEAVGILWAVNAAAAGRPVTLCQASRCGGVPRHSPQVCTLDGADHMLAVPGGDQAAAWCELRRALEAFLGSRLQELARGS